MHRLRHLTLLATTATAIATTAAPSVRVSPPATVPDGPVYLRLPRIGRIVVRPDTVWFCGHIEAGDALADYFYVRRTREWRRVAGPTASACVAEGVPGAPISDTIRGADYQVVRIDSTRFDSAGQRSGRAHLQVIDRAFGRQTDLLPRLDPKRRSAFLAEYGEGVDLDFAAFGAIASNDTLIWIGLAGGFPEGEGAVGGIFKVSRPTGRYELLLDTLLEDATVSALVDGGRWLWVGTKVPGEYGWGGDVGLLRYDVRTRVWHSYQERTSPLPDPVIGPVTSDGQLLAVATARGLAVVELRTGSDTTLPVGRDEAIGGWDVRYFIPSFARDSLVFDVGSKEQYQRQEADEARYKFVQRLSLVGHERPLFDALAHIRSDSLSQWIEDEAAWDRIGAKLADATLLPMLFDIASRGEGRLLVAGAIGALGEKAPAAAVDSMRRAFLAYGAPGASPYNTDPWRSAYGRALALAGDSTSIRWARAVLQHALSRSPATRDSARRGELYNSELPAAAEILAAVRDRTGLSLIISAVPIASWTEGTAFVSALAAYDDPNAWRAMVGFASAFRTLRGQAVRVLTVSAMRDPAVSDAVMHFVREELRGGPKDAPMAVIYGVGVLRLHELAPDLVRLLLRAPSSWPSTFLGELTIRVLVKLTGRADAPVFAEELPPRPVVEWWARLAAQPAGLPQALPAQGRRSEDEWVKRLAAMRQSR